MNGILLAFISALFWSLLDLLRKLLVEEINPILAAGLVSAGSGILFLPLLLLSTDKKFPMQLIPWSLFIFSTAINVAAVSLFFKALRVSPLSLTVPYLNFTPVFMVFTGILLLKELPSIDSLLGIFLVVIGAFILNYGSIKNPLAPLLKEKGSWMMLAVAALWSVTGPLEKIMLKSFDPISLGLLSSISIGLSILSLNLKEISEKKLKLSRKTLRILSLTFLIQLLAIFTQFLAVQKVFVAYVDTIKRSGTVISVLFGYFYLREKPLFPRLIGSFIMMAGAVVLTLSLYQ